ncbi:endonuclease/exonuclease/phosphatase family protein [Crateriforma conspicua]|uniref:endonuclease/exonuclease/phosphatase family protein n=1 Tax=Crateriforma conspicua TaxID=2527996 RepID=UPI00118BDED4|nr:endonuclease/exonuclease/phosphatase family protein [Crateriforma conspicua]QDV65090.1 Endonuclease/Exonuclease/phosphatase family protein [Crateriforma conspicua]
MGLLFNKKRRRRSKSRSLLGSLPLVRWIGPGLTGGGILATMLGAFTGQIDLPSLDKYRGESPPIEMRPISLRQLGEKSAETIRVATFNIQVFAEAKSNNRTVMQQIAGIVANFDVVAIQEVKSKGVALDRLMEILNQDVPRGGRPHYQAVMSQPLGRTNQKEHYAFVWDDRRIALVPDSQYVVQDGEPNSESDFLHREPMVASFQVRPLPNQTRQPFRFTMINMHTDPDEVRGDSRTNEMNVLDDVFNNIRSWEYSQHGEDDYMLVGDLNVDVPNLGEMGQIPGIASLAGGLTTNTARNKTYDHILIDRYTMQEFIPGRAGVVDFVNDLGITSEQAKAISDHLPVFAEFSAFEIPPPSPDQSTTNVALRGAAETSGGNRAANRLRR